MDENLEKPAKQITPRFNRKTARVIVDEEQKRMEKKLQAIRDKYDALIRNIKEEDEGEGEACTKR
ncbi:hypothetical protein [Sporosarcina koreensis]|uniref:Uncharacterized protein n=1 Tax=Sporosarcina koreensis TaxID=334735 RepID=A0ABW0U0I1_9BACL